MAQLKKIAFNDVGIKALQLKKRLLSCFSTVINSTQFLLGKENNKLQSRLRDYFKFPYAHLVASGHDALLLSIQALHLTPEDEVIVPVNAYPTAFPIALCRVKIKLCDVDENGQISINFLNKLITQKTKAMVLVYMFGLTAKVDEIVNIAQENKIYLIEDCAQAFGTKYKNQLVGTFGDIGCFSFYPTKNIGTLGDGGCIITKNKKIFDYVYMAASYGEGVRYQSKFVSGHSRLPELQAAVLNTYFETTEADFDKRKKLFTYYQKEINARLHPYVRYLISHPSSDPIPHLLVIEGKRRNELAKHLAKSGIETHIHYPLPVHLVEAFFYLGYKLGDFPTAERFSKNILSLPFHSSLTKKQIDFIIKKIQEFYEKVK